MGFSNERMRTGQLVNWFLLDGLEMTPAGNPITKALPLPFGVDHLIGFNELLTCKHPESAGVHFFLDDYQFERFWRQPERYLNALAKFPMVLGPTFSLYTDFPAPIQRWNHYRNHFWQHGFRPTVSVAFRPLDGRAQTATAGASMDSARAVQWRSVPWAPECTAAPRMHSGRVLLPCWTPVNRRKSCSTARCRRTPQHCSGSVAFSGRHSRTGWQNVCAVRHFWIQTVRRRSNVPRRSKLRRVPRRKRR